jgi:hypothetical protein
MEAMGESDEVCRYESPSLHIYSGKWRECGKKIGGNEVARETFIPGGGSNRDKRLGEAYLGGPFVTVGGCNRD